jgi:acyl-homoserine lactone synthase
VISSSPEERAMIHVVTKANRAIYQEQMEEQFHIRHDIYVKQRKWMDLDRPDGREIDQFDNDDATYLLMLEDNRVIGGSRFVPTIKPHLMSEVFAFLANVRGVQRGHDIVEWTRIFIVPEKRSVFNLKKMYAGVLEYCLNEGFNTITIVMETWWIPRFLELGWDVIPLGEPMMHATNICQKCKHFAHQMWFYCRHET